MKNIYYNLCYDVQVNASKSVRHNDELSEIRLFDIRGQLNRLSSTFYERLNLEQILLISFVMMFVILLFYFKTSIK